MAELEDDAEARAAWLTFVVVGGGPTGVEIAGQIAELGSRALSENSYRGLTPRDVRVILCDGGKEILATFGDKPGAARHRASCSAPGSRSSTETIVQNVDATGVEVRAADGSTTRIDPDPDGDLGGGRGGLAAGPDAGRRYRRGVRPGRPHRGAAGLLAARASRRCSRSAT